MLVCTGGNAVAFTSCWSFLRAEGVISGYIALLQLRQTETKARLAKTPSVPGWAASSSQQELVKGISDVRWLGVSKESSNVPDLDTETEGVPLLPKGKYSCQQIP